MASSLRGNEEWSRTSDPRVNFDGKVGKWRLKKNFTLGVKNFAILRQSPGGGSNDTLLAPQLRTRVQRRKADPPPRPDQLKNSGLGPAAEWVAVKLPSGECGSVP